MRALLRPLLALVLALAAGAALAADGVDVYFFWRVGCPHCERAAAYLERLRAERPELRVHAIELGESAEARALFLRLSEDLGRDSPAVPLVVVGEAGFVGYRDDATTGAAIREAARACLAAPCADKVAAMRERLTRSGTPAGQLPSGSARSPLPPRVHLPILGDVDTAALSLPALTVALAAADGFNPCAMWTLVFLVGLLVGLKDPARMWVLGGAFVGASALVYFLIMAAWLNALLAFGMLPWVRVAIGLVAIGAGAWWLREFARGGEIACEITAPEHRRRVMRRLRELASERSFVLALAGIVALAFVVNLIEFVCSAGIPAVYTQVLALSGLPRWQHYGYLVLYIAVFMLDDLVVLATALATLQVSGLTGRYTRWSHLVGGTLLVGVGALLVFRPQWLVFG